MAAHQQLAIDAGVGPGSGSRRSSFSLFPNPHASRPPPSVPRLHPNPRPKRSASRERARQERQQQLQLQNNELQHSSSDAQYAPEQLSHTPLHLDTTTTRTSSNTPSSHLQQARQVAVAAASPILTHPDANMPKRDNSARASSSIAKPSPPNIPSSCTQLSAQPALLRSIFPTYNPDVPLHQQAYAPTLISRPSNIPRAVMSRQSYYDPNAVSITENGGQASTSDTPLPPRSSPTRHQQQNIAAFSTPVREPVPCRASSLPVMPTTSTTEQLKILWKAANGWKATPSEGQTFCLKLAQQKDARVYTLSSASQPFYSLRLDPTSASALVSLSRHDPSKKFKSPKADSRWSSTSLVSFSSSSSSVVKTGTGTGTRSGGSKHWQQVLRTTVEEDSRRHSPGDGLVALLMPEAAIKMATERGSEPALVAVAERELARLVWDYDTYGDDGSVAGHYYLVHPAMAASFRVVIDRRPAWSRVEYRLEHHDSARHLARLTRDGIGGGWLEVDTSVAANIEVYYIIDVAVAALLIVAVADEQGGGPYGGGGVGGGVGCTAGAGAGGMETFEPPPFAPVDMAARKQGSSNRRFSRHFSILGGGKKKKREAKRQSSLRQRPMEEFEIDVESQDGGSLGKSSGTTARVKSKEEETEDKLPFLLRVSVKMAKGVFKCVIWMLTAIFRLVSGCVGCK